MKNTINNFFDYDNIRTGKLDQQYRIDVFQSKVLDKCVGQALKNQDDGIPLEDHLIDSNKIF